MTPNIDDVIVDFGVDVVDVIVNVVVNVLIIDVVDSIVDVVAAHVDADLVDKVVTSRRQVFFLAMAINFRMTEMCQLWRNILTSVKFLQWRERKKPIYCDHKSILSNIFIRSVN